MKKGKNRQRKLHIDGCIWTYHVGDVYIGIWSPEGKKFLTDISEVSGWPWDDIERGKWKGNWKGISPSMVKNFIKALLKGRLK